MTQLLSLNDHSGCAIYNCAYTQSDQIPQTNPVQKSFIYDQSLSRYYIGAHYSETLRFSCRVDISHRQPIHKPDSDVLDSDFHIKIFHDPW